MDGARTVPYRRIGTILVDRRLITAEQLDVALVEQENTGRPLGEICVARYGLDRLALADGLTEQWDEMQRVGAGAARECAAGGDGASVSRAEASQGWAEAEELRILLEEAEAARSELASKTDELGRRLAVLESLVVGVTDALRELRPNAPDPATARPRAAAAGPRRVRNGHALLRAPPDDGPPRPDVPVAAARRRAV